MTSGRKEARHDIPPPPSRPFYARASTILAIVSIAIAVGLHQRVTTPHDPTAPSSLAIEAAGLIPGVKAYTLPVADGLHSTVLYKQGKGLNILYSLLFPG